MQPAMIAKPSALRRVGQRERLGQAAGLVELDVDRVVAAGAARRASPRPMHALVGADRHGRRTRARARVLAGRQRLLDQRRPPPRRRRRCSRSRSAGVQRLVGVDDQPRSGAARRTAAIRAGSPSPPSLILSSGRRGAPARGRRHRLGRAEAERVGGGQPGGRRQAERSPRPAGRSLGLEVQQRAVDAHCAPRRPASRCAARARSSPAPIGAGHRLDRAPRFRRRFAIAGIGHCIRRGPIGRPRGSSATTTRPRSASRARW